ncbi:helix-turn-helix domain-containing protein [Escherichia coli]|nr:helix-turn-helix domain-containing protein [Escherichia coli]EHW5476354.1 helix-turn-helix domain-containing protein [Escherichia coli]EIR0072138.1 helix-turn-helix domain-containing protein [Escherichia coli]
MAAQEVITDAQIRQRLLDLEEQNKKLRQELLDERRNTNFTQTYPKGWERIRNLIQANPGAARLYSVLSEHIDGNCGAVVADQQFLADQLSVTTRTIRNWVNFLEENKCLVRIPVAGKLCAYALNPTEVWKGYNTSKPYAAFLTKTLVNSEGVIKRRLQACFGTSEPNE